MTDVFSIFGLWICSVGIVIVDSYCPRIFPVTGQDWTCTGSRARWLAIAIILYRGTNLSAIPILLIYSHNLIFSFNGRIIWFILGTMEVVFLLFVLSWPIVLYFAKDKQRSGDLLFAIYLATSHVILIIPGAITIFVLLRYSFVTEAWNQLKPLDTLGLVQGCVWLTWYIRWWYKFIKAGSEGYNF